MPDLTTLDVGLDGLILFKGRPTSGKTRALFGFPKPLRLYDLDGKVETIVKDYAGQFKPGDISYEKFSGTDYERLDAFMEEDLKSGKYRTVAVDSLTSLSEMILKYMIKLRGGNPDAKGKAKGVIDFNTIEDYGGEASALMDIINFLVGFGGQGKGVYKILTAHVIPVETKNAAGQVIDTKWELMTGGKKIAAKIPGRFKEIWHFTVERNAKVGGLPIYRVNTMNDGIDFANTMLPLPREIDWSGKNLFAEVKQLCAVKGVNLV